MREIMFRGKREDNGEWVFGWYSADYRYPRILTEYLDYIVVSETVGQYTGLKDKNGVEIYEGDIVENTTQTVYLGDKYEVVWNKNYAGYQLMSNGLTSNIPLTQNFMSYKVIGNIHDNPELICTHTKKYDNVLLTSLPPKQRWVCTKCGETGIDVIGSPEQGITQSCETTGHDFKRIGFIHLSYLNKQYDLYECIRCGKQEYRN